jgi:hypothetical protein
MGSHSEFQQQQLPGERLSAVLLPLGFGRGQRGHRGLMVRACEPDFFEFPAGALREFPQNRIGLGVI